MATLLSIQDGNFTTNTTWGVVDATSFLDTVAAVTTVTTAAANSTAFTPGAIVVSGIALQLQSRTGPGTAIGTFTVQIWNTTANAAVSGASVTVNVSDVPNTASTAGDRGLGWVYFKFASNVTLLAATSYAVRLNTSSASQIVAYTTTGTNWSRALVTTTNATPAATDTTIIAGSYTGAGASTSVTVTMNSTSSATAYGTVYIGAKGLLNYGTSAATNYILRITGNLFIGREGELRIGNSTSPIPDDSTARLELNVTTSGQYGLIIHGGTLTTYGKIKTPSVLLAADAAVAATSITLNTTPTGWTSGDLIGIPSTTVTAAQAEVKALSANVTTTTASIAALTNAHGGNSTTLVQADLINLTRNVVITVGATTNVVTFVRINGYGTIVNCKYTQFLQCGTNAASSAGISLWSNAAALNNTIDVQYCSLYQSATVASSLGFYVGQTGLGGLENSNFIFSNNVVYGMGAAALTVLPNTAVSSPTYENNIFVRNGPSVIYDWRGTSTNNVFASGTGNGLNISVYTSGLVVGSTTIFSGFKFYSNAGSGANFAVNTNYAALGASNYTFPSWRTFRNASGIGVNIQNFEMCHPQSQITFSGMYAFGNVSFNVLCSSPQRVIFDSCYFWSGTTQTTQYAYSAQNIATQVFNESTYFNNCVFGRDYLGNTSNFTVAIFYGLGTRGGGIFVNNPTFSGTVISRNSLSRSWTYAQGVIVTRENSVSGANTIYTNYGNISLDSSIFYISGPSIRLTPAASSQKNGTPTVRIPVLSGQTCTIKVWVRKSAAGDGAAYNGNQPTLIYRYNSLSGIASDTVGATGAAAVGTWEQLSYTIPAVTNDTVAEFYVDCDGTTGWVNVDEWTCSSNQFSRGGKYWGINMGIFNDPAFTLPGGNYTFIS